MNLWPKLLFSPDEGAEGSSGGASQDYSDDTFDNIDVDIDGFGNDDGEGKVKHENDKVTDKPQHDIIKNNTTKTEADKKEGGEGAKRAEKKGKESEEKDKEGEVTEEDIADMLNGKYGDTDYELHPDTSFSFGEDDSVTLQNLLDSYKTKDDWYKDFDSVKAQRKEAEKLMRDNYESLEKAKMVEQRFNHIKEGFGEKPSESIYHVLDSLGVSGNDGFNALAEMLFPNFEQVLEMDEDQLKNYMLERKTEFLSGFQGVQTHCVFPLQPKKITEQLDTLGPLSIAS
jgi:hypothetical protein